MTKYTYGIVEAADRVNVTVMEGPSQVASSIIFRDRLDFESYSVPAAYQGRGLSYVLTYLMLLYCKDNNTLAPTVSNAHGVLMQSLPKSGFPMDGQVRVTNGGRVRAASYRCANIQVSLTGIKKILIVKGIISDGLRFTGPYQWRSPQ
jgi:hypothetical protein